MRARDERWANGDVKLGRQLLAAARAGGSQFADQFNATFLGHRLETIANLHVLLWGVTASALRSGRRRSRADLEQLASLAAASANHDLFDDARAGVTLRGAQQGAEALPDLATNLASDRSGLYTVAVCCNAAIDHRMHYSTVLSDSWQKRYRIYSTVLRMQINHHDRKARGDHS